MLIGAVATLQANCTPGPATENTKHPTLVPGTEAVNVLVIVWGIRSLPTENVVQTVLLSSQTLQTFLELILPGLNTGGRSDRDIPSNCLFDRVLTCLLILLKRARGSKLLLACLLTISSLLVSVSPNDLLARSRSLSVCLQSGATELQDPPDVPANTQYYVAAVFSCSNQFWLLAPAWES